MTKKKEQKTQKVSPKEVNEESSVDSDAVLDLETQLADAQQSAKDNWDKLLRSQAEMENLKRRIHQHYRVRLTTPPKTGPDTTQFLFIRYLFA